MSCNVFVSTPFVTAVEIIRRCQCASNGPQIEPLKCSKCENKWIQDAEVSELPRGTRHVSHSLGENSKRDLVTGLSAVYIYLPVGVSALFIAEYLSPTSRPLLASVSISSLLAVSFSLSVNSASLGLCHITQSAQDAAAEACWQRRQEMMPTPRAGIRLITKMDSHLISIPPVLPIHSNQTTVGDLTLDAPFHCVLQQDAFYMSWE